MQDTVIPSLELKIKLFVDSVNDGDENAFLSLFRDDGRVVDSGRSFRGIDEIRKWSEREFVGAEGRLTVRYLRKVRDKTVVMRADWKNDFYTGSARMELVFAEDNDGISELIIQTG